MSDFPKAFNSSQKNTMSTFIIRVAFYLRLSLSHSAHNLVLLQCPFTGADVMPYCTFCSKCDSRCCCYTFSNSSLQVNKCYSTNQKLWKSYVHIFATVATVNTVHNTFMHMRMWIHDSGFIRRTAALFQKISLLNSFNLS